MTLTTKKYGDIIYLKVQVTKGQLMAKIIITDDEPMNRRMTEFMLTKNGYETVKASSGEECLSKLSDGADLVLLDVMMPGLNGFETLKRMRGVGITIPVIFLTAAEDNETLHEAEELGVPCVRKPFRPDDLLSAVRNAIGVDK